MASRELAHLVAEGGDRVRSLKDLDAVVAAIPVQPEEPAEAEGAEQPDDPCGACQTCKLDTQRRSVWAVSGGFSLFVAVAVDAQPWDLKHFSAQQHASER